MSKAFVKMKETVNWQEGRDCCGQADEHLDQEDPGSQADREKTNMNKTNSGPETDKNGDESKENYKVNENIEEIK